MTMKSGLPTGMIRKRLEFKYDYLGRRVQKIVKNNWTGTSGTTATHLKYVYDGHNLIAELDGSTTNKTVLSTYVWGLDLSGTTWGAGGVGGLLMIKDGTKTYFPGYDGNGNVSALLDSADGSLDAKYEYSAFGEPLRVGGAAIAEDNPFRFSTKYTDVESGLVYYGFRYYSPSLGRFLNRDPIEELGGSNLYAFVENDPVNGWDYLGLDDELLCDPADYSAGLCDEGPRKRGFLKRLGSFFGGIGKGIGNAIGGVGRAVGSIGQGLGRAVGNVARGVGNIGGDIISAAGKIGRGVVSTAAKVARAAVEVEQRQVVKITVSANGEIKLDGYTEVGRKNNPFEKQSKADSDFSKAIDQAIAQIKDGLLTRAFSPDPGAAKAFKLYQALNAMLMNKQIMFEEVRNPRKIAGGINRLRTKGLVRWHPQHTSVAKGITSAPYMTLAHELFHVLDGFEHSPEFKDALKATDARWQTNLWEFMAIEKENLVRPLGDPPREFHDPNKYAINHFWT